VREATGSVLTNKYAEGLPGKRYYGGCEHVDEAENLARDRVKALFGADHANVQPHSGSSANMAAYRALLQPGDRILAMRLDQGGHLTHGSPVNFSGSDYEVVAYGVDAQSERIDYDELAAMAREHRPKMILQQRAEALQGAVEEAARGESLCAFRHRSKDSRGSGARAVGLARRSWTAGGRELGRLEWTMNGNARRAESLQRLALGRAGLARVGLGRLAALLDHQQHPLVLQAG
jgi:hypothetical protein